MYRNCGLISNSLKLLPCLFMLFAPSYRLSWLSPHKHGTFLTPAYIQTYQCCWEECTWNLSDSEDNYDRKCSNKNTESRWTPADTLCIFRQVTQPSSTYSSLALPAHWLVVMHEMTRVLLLMKHCHLVWETKECHLSVFCHSHRFNGSDLSVGLFIIHCSPPCAFYYLEYTNMYSCIPVLLECVPQNAFIWFIFKDLLLFFLFHL